MWLTRLAISRPVLIWTALAAIAILGLVSYGRLPAELNPRVDIPTVTVLTVYPGAGPREVESLVTRPIEDAVGSAAGLRDVYSSSQESLSVVSMDFRVGTDVNRALSEVKQKVDLARASLPDDARAPIVAKLDINALPVVQFSLSGRLSPDRLRRIVDEVVTPRLARIDGVGSVTVAGGRQREVRVQCDPQRLQALGVTVEDVANAVRAGGRDVPAGSLAWGSRDTSVRALAAFVLLDDIADSPIFSAQTLAQSLIPDLPIPGAPRRPDVPAPLVVGDVASVDEALAEPETLARANGRDSVAVIVTRTPDANTVAVVEETLAEMRQLQRGPLAGVDVAVARNEAVVVADALEDVNATLVLGAILAMAIVYLFLHNLRGTFIVALALPSCIVATFIVLWAFGFTLNQMTLLALSLSVGILVDDSIVVLESITRHLGLGEAPTEAAYNGRTEIGFAGITLTLADVVVFLPIAFMGGIIGAFFRQFGVTVAAATLFSLLVSFTVTPSIAARWYRQGEDPEHARNGRLGRLAASMGWVEERYRSLLRWSLARRGWVLAWAAAVLVAVVLVATPHLSVELLPAVDQGQIGIVIEAPSGSSLAATDAIALKVEERVRRLGDVANVVTTVGEVLGGFGAIPQKGPEHAQISVRLTDRPDLLRSLLTLGRQSRNARRARSDEDVATDIRRAVADIPGARITVTAVRSVASVGAPIQLQLRGQQMEALGREAERLRDRLATMPGIVDPVSSYRPGRPEARWEIDRARAAALGVPPAQAGAILRMAVAGEEAAVYRVGGSETPVRVRLARGDVRSGADLGEMTVGYAGGRAVTLRDVAELRAGSGPSAIERVNGQRMVTINANLAAGTALGDAQRDIEAAMADMDLAGIEHHFGGEAEAMNENIPYFVAALGLAVALSYLVMASLFNSFLHPFTIMFTLPMALAGALAALVLTGETMSLVSMVGVLMLTGLMGRNAILLVDYTATLRARGADMATAVVEAGATRLRPILMTTLATIFGMLPVALRIGRASELRAPMAIVVIGGLAVSTVLTLVVIPTLYTLFEDARDRLARGRAAAGPQGKG